jgi:hypothetical protein
VNAVCTPTGGGSTRVTTIAPTAATVADSAIETGTSALDQLRLMAAARTERERVCLREEFFAGRRKLFRLLAHRLCRTLGLPHALHREDVEQLVALEAVTFVDELLVEPARIEQLANWEGMLHVRARASVRAWADRHLSPASGMVSLSRRVRQLNQLRDELRAAGGCEPEARELAAEHNRRMAATRKDAAKQGMLAVAGEVDLTRPVVDIHALELAATLPEGGLLHPTEGPRLVHAVIAKARAIGGVTAAVAECWLSGVYGSEGDQRVLTPREVAEQLGLPPQSASAQIRKVRAVAKRVLAEELDIHHA